MKRSIISKQINEKLETFRREGEPLDDFQRGYWEAFAMIGYMLRDEINYQKFLPVVARIWFQ